MLCEDLKCQYLKEGKCEKYSIEGMKFRDRMGYCPIIDDGLSELEFSKKDKKRKHITKPTILMSAYGHDWKSRVRCKIEKQSHTPGNQKVLTCRHLPPKKYLATSSRSYKHPQFKNWIEIFGRR